MIKEIVEAVTIPVMAKVRIGHFVEAQVRHDLMKIPYSCFFPTYYCALIVLRC